MLELVILYSWGWCFCCAYLAVFDQKLTLSDMLIALLWPLVLGVAFGEIYKATCKNKKDSK